MSAVDLHPHLLGTIDVKVKDGWVAENAQDRVHLVIGIVLVHQIAITAGIAHVRDL
jgi:hypothetical protein